MVSATDLSESFGLFVVQIEVKNLTPHFFEGSFPDFIRLIWPNRAMFSNESFSEVSSDTAVTLDQRLINLTYLLARLAAREAFAKITGGQSTNRMPTFQSDISDD